MSRRPASASACGGDVAGVRAAADQVRGAGDHRDAVGAAGAGGGERGRELGEAGAVGGGGRDLGRGGVVVAGERGAEAAGLGDGGGLVAGAVPRLQVLEHGDVGLELGLGHGAAAGGVVAQLVDVGELALARGVVHQADDADAVVGREGGELVLEGLGADLGAQVQAVADAQAPASRKLRIAVARGRA